jgi:hypothetical protein
MMLQEIPLVVSRPFLVGLFRVFLAELVINPNKVGKKQSEEYDPDDDPEKVVVAWRIPIDDLVLHLSPPIYI